MSCSKIVLDKRLRPISESKKAVVYLPISDIPNDPLAVDRQHLANVNYYKKRISLRRYLLGFRTKNRLKNARCNQRTESFAQANPA